MHSYYETKDMICVDTEAKRRLYIQKNNIIYIERIKEKESSYETIKRIINEKKQKQSKEIIENE